VFNKELFLKSVSDEQRMFYTEFSATTMFHEFIDAMADETQEKISRFAVPRMSCEGHRERRARYSSGLIDDEEVTADRSDAGPEDEGSILAAE
jgi:hypothetical protein